MARVKRVLVLRENLPARIIRAEQPLQRLSLNKVCDNVSRVSGLDTVITNISRARVLC